jgi:hypothetical protein
MATEFRRLARWLFEAIKTCRSARFRGLRFVAHIWRSACLGDLVDKHCSVSGRIHPTVTGVELVAALPVETGSAPSA